MQGRTSDPILADIIANTLTIRDAASGHKKILESKRLPDMDYFSVSNIEEMKHAFDFCQKIVDDNSKFSDPVFFLCEETHKEKSWKSTNSRQKLDFELFVDEDTPNREELISHMKEVSSWLTL